MAVAVPRVRRGWPPCHRDNEPTLAAVNRTEVNQREPVPPSARPEAGGASRPGAAPRAREAARALMKDAVRVILVDPNARSRQTLQKQLEAVADIELIEVCPAYQQAIRRISALAPEMA